MRSSTATNSSLVVVKPRVLLARAAAGDLALELLHHDQLRDAGGEGAAHHGGLGRAIESLELHQQAGNVRHTAKIRSLTAWASPTTSRRSSTRCRPTGRTWSSTC